MTNSTAFVDPFAGSYYVNARSRAEVLAYAPTLGHVTGYDIVRYVEGTHSTLYIGRTESRSLVAIKGFRLDAPVTAGWQATRDNEVMRMIRFRHGGLLPIETVWSDVSGGPVRYLCMPYCQGGSLRDRLDAGNIGVAELAYHGWVVVTAARRLHQSGFMHGDIKPENVLLAFGVDDGIRAAESGWRTWLSDLETVAKIGGPTSWRMTPAYAAPEQVTGAPAAAQMDVWAWGKTMHDGISMIGSLTDRWSWLLDLVERAMSADPESRPTSDEIIEVYGQHIGFGEQRPVIGAESETAVAWYPTSLVSSDSSHMWVKREGAEFVSMSLGWAAWLPECYQLYRLNTPAALLRIEDMCMRVLGNPLDPGSTWHAFRDRHATALPVGAEAGFNIGLAHSCDHRDSHSTSIPRLSALEFAKLLVTALVELAETSGEETDLDRLHVAAQAWESIGEFDCDTASAVLAQAWLILDDPERALPHLRRANAADPTDVSALAASRLYYVVTGDRRKAANIAWQPKPQASGQETLRWVILAASDLLAAGEFDELDEVLTAFDRRQVDMFELFRAVLSVRRGQVVPEADWLWLKESSKALNEITIEKLGLLLEVANHQGDREFAIRRANVARTLPTIRRPIHHQTRAAIEAIVLGRDPANRSLTERLKIRAELWSRDGRQHDPLTGLCLAAAQRWVAVGDRMGTSEGVRDLVQYSEDHAAKHAVDVQQWPRRCSGCASGERLELLSICGHCHRLYCAECTLFLPHEQCFCGGDIVRGSGGRSWRAVQS